MKINKKDTQSLSYGAFAAFGTYFCMYAFRKPFTVATFENLFICGVDYKIILIITQVMGYALSKFIGVKLISELKANKRLPYLICMIVTAELSLLFFGWVPMPYNVVFMFLNGLSLGMIWGVVFSYLEGRKFTEILGVILCSSFIVSSGAVKSIGLLVMNMLHISEIWMPAVTGAFFLAPFFIFAILLERMSPPTTEDIALRSERNTMTKRERKNLLRNFWFPILILVFFYVTLTVLRDFRDNFSREIWDAIGYENSTSIYTVSEIPIAILVLLILGSMHFIKDNQRAFEYYHYILVFGSLLIGLTTILYQLTYISPVVWMIVTGFGLYICYVPFNGIFFDRMIATFHINGNSGFLIYVADAFGYLGSIVVLLYKNFGQGSISWLQFFINSTYIITIIGVSVSLVSLIHFKRKHKKELQSQPSLKII